MISTERRERRGGDQGIFQTTSNTCLTSHMHNPKKKTEKQKKQNCDWNHCEHAMTSASAVCIKVLRWQVRTFKRSLSFGATHCGVERGERTEAQEGQRKSLEYEQTHIRGFPLGAGVSSLRSW